MTDENREIAPRPTLHEVVDTAREVVKAMTPAEITSARNTGLLDPRLHREEGPVDLRHALADALLATQVSLRWLDERDRLELADALLDMPEMQAIRRLVRRECFDLMDRLSPLATGWIEGAA